MATVLLEGLVDAVSGCFSGSSWCLAVFSWVICVPPLGCGGLFSGVLSLNDG